MASETPITVPDGYTLHTENTSHILLPSTNEAFLNPVQEFNRDLSVATIRVWSEEFDKAKEQKWKQAQAKKAKKSEAGEDKTRKRPKLDVDDASKAPSGFAPPEASAEGDKPQESASGSGDADKSTLQAKDTEVTSPCASHELLHICTPQYRNYKFVLLEALSATGLRSIRYAKEIPLVKYVIANDLSPSATAAMKRNVDLNGLGDETPASDPAETAEAGKTTTRRAKLGKVRINEGDARALMYSHSQERSRVDVVDLDPYGTAAPFIDAAVQCINDGGLLCVTCTDLSVLATNNYPEKCYSNYGGVPVKAEYSHEVALRLVLNTIATSAARYGRFIQPMISLSIDFYVRLFVKVQTAPFEVKKTASKTSIHYVCSGCQSFYGQPLGRVVEKVSEKGNVNSLFKTQTGPPVSEKCPECNSALHVAGPMWSGPIHDPPFIGKVLEHLEGNQEKYGTATRMKGMLTVAQEELQAPFYFTPSRVASFFHCVCPALDDVGSALLNGGHQISRSHAAAGSLKTTASRREIHDIFRSWAKLHPVKMEKIAENSPSRVLLGKEPTTEANFTRHPRTVTPSSKVKLVRYQPNPTPNWGPGTKAQGGTKRKHEDD
ncbi:N2 N2-dimethylguanosine tRNA methyltransferase [Artomyces pyxidatus]|uniref:N2 N2-dimethylguanosine tRNA methyltransferase n=1 Tax=Artomyces pyxidatus TaxID=48021 RepID=A0ACB8TA87_9AGAM|nr:N2 N2-dimethylguanosine tRNA methyltransferase [Artomyces pyxidatus]